MKEQIRTLQMMKAEILSDAAIMCNEPTEHGSLEQARQMTIQSIAYKAASDIDSAMMQLSILNQHLY